MTDTGDLLGDAAWECASFASDARTRPPATGDAAWMPAPVPGTVGQALDATGRPVDVDIDAFDWWYRASFASHIPRATLVLEGLAVLADVWVNGVRVAQTRSMFSTERISLEGLGDHNDVAIRFRSLDAALSGPRRRPRARWRVARLRHPGLRWLRGSLWGRLNGVVAVPPPVGPWRGVRLVASDIPAIVRRGLRARCDGADGVVDAAIVVTAAARPRRAMLKVGDEPAVPLDVRPAPDGEGWLLSGTARVAEAEVWWPHTMGAQPLYAVEVECDGHVLSAGAVGFRDLHVDEADGGFRFVVNGAPVFVGGACWMPIDPVRLDVDEDRLRAALQQVCDAHLSMLRVCGDTVYESDAFYRLCDAMGILVWQDCMLAFADPPADPEWEQLFLREVAQNLDRLSGRPCLALVSGGTEIAQQAAYAGVASDIGLPLLTDRLPQAVRAAVGDVPYLPTSPWGGDVPTRPDSGVAHYYGVGAYLRDLDDARRSGVRFAAECLAFANPPDRQTVEEHFGGAHAAGHDPRWKRAVFRDAGASWDFEDVRDRYVRELFAVDPLEVRRTDPDRYLDLGRAAVAHLVARTFAEWRRAGSASGGGLVYYLRDSLPGAGMGLVDAIGRPKSVWYALRRVLAPLAVSLHDEGLNGVVAHVHNATACPRVLALTVDLFVGGEVRNDSAVRELTVEPHTSVAVGVDALFGGFRDLSWAHRFGPLTYDVVGAQLRDSDGRVVSTDVLLPGGLARPVERDLGLGATWRRRDGDTAEVTVFARRFAQFVTVTAPGWQPDDSAFDLAPGTARVIALQRVDPAAGSTAILSVLNGPTVTCRGD